jgi:hypothetical protein
MERRIRNYSKDQDTQENMDIDNKYNISGESNFTRDLSTPFEENDAITERDFSPQRAVFDDRTRKRNDYRGVGPKGYRRSDDRILEDACERLYRSPEVDPSNIEVSVEEGIIILKGSVGKRSYKLAAERIIEHLPGVVDVRNEVVVERDTGGLVQNRTSMN